MVNSSSLDATFSALSDPSRRAILARLARSEQTVGELARPLPMSLPAVSKHIRILENAGLVATRKEGRSRHLRLVPRALAPAQDWIARHTAFWEDSLDALGRYLHATRPPDSEAFLSTRPVKSPGTSRDAPRPRAARKNVPFPSTSNRRTKGDSR